MRKPRPFNHKLIYVDERQERLRAIEQQAGMEQDARPLTDYMLLHMQGVFTAARKSKRGGGLSLSVPMLLSLLLILLAVVLIITFSN